MPSPFSDITASTRSSFATINATSPAGEAWMIDNVGEPDAAPGSISAWYVEHRYAPDILLAAYTFGLTVRVDGKLADAPRKAVGQ